MGSMSIWHWLVVVALVALLFGGKGRLSNVMGDAAKGIRAFRDGLKAEPETEAEKTGAALPRTDAEKEELRK
ncbi:MAG TPA: twin-arginine translocase TatA/TatE family subunit [Caulobacteraceae bacterium]